MNSSGHTPITRDLEIEALKETVRWPNAEPWTIVVLAGQLLTSRRDQESFAYFSERAEAGPEQPLFLALEGLFQARLAGQQSLIHRTSWLRDATAKLDRAVALAPGLTNYFRGLVLAELPAWLGGAEAAVTDLEWVLANKDHFPVGFRRSVYRSLAKAYAALGRSEAAREARLLSGARSHQSDDVQFFTDYWMTAEDGFHFTLPRLVQPVPGVYVAQGYDFADFAFVVTDDGIVAIDAGTTEAHVRAALEDLRQITDLPISQIILTHAHWDHVGGLDALIDAGPRVIARENFADELEIVNGTGVPLRSFFGAAAKQHVDFVPDQLLREPESLTIGGIEFVLYPVRGGETNDALLIHLPASGVVFTGDTIMPQLGAPFLAEGSAEGLFEAMQLIQSLQPRLLIHGHTPLTERFTIAALPGLEAALRDLHARILLGIRHGETVIQILHQNHLPEVLRAHPAAVIPFLVMRDNVIRRVYHQRTGYWKPDGDGVELFAPAEWAAALDLLGGGKESAFVTSVRTLLAQGDHALALKLVDLGLMRHPKSQALADLRRQTLDRLRKHNQQLNPFKFIVYSGWAGAELLPAN